MTEQPKDIVLSNNDMHPAEEIAHLKDLLGKANALARIRAERIKELEAQAGSEPEPVAWRGYTVTNGYTLHHYYGEAHRVASQIEPLYTHPPARVPNWIRAIDEELVGTFIGVANVSDTYEVAKKKLGELIDWHVQVAIDPAVNGGCVLVPARVPLTEDDLHRLVNEFFYEGMTPTGKHLKNFAHAIIAAYEAKNGIGGGK